MEHAVVARALLGWFARNQRPLPWRVGYAPYAVWVSEVMLQQTQVERVVGYFQRWMRRFPDVASLAQADEEEVLKHWEGLGYYSRARNLHQAARLLHARHGDRLPADLQGLRALPGVGAYTAAAVASLAFNQDVPVIDANVERVLARLLDLDTPVKEPAARGRMEAELRLLLPSGRARDFNQALMELGALVCAKRPRCADCPIEGHCESRRLGIETERPVPAKAREIIPLEVATGLLTVQGRVLIQKRLLQGVWPGLWEFPGGRVEPGETPAQAVVREFMEEVALDVGVHAGLGVVRHGYTTYRVALHCFALRPVLSFAAPPIPALNAASDYRWATPEELGDYALPAGHRKLLDRLEQEPEAWSMVFGV